MESEDKGVWFYDIETLKNCFTYTGINRDTKEVVTFVVCNNINQLEGLYEHLRKCKGQIGFNNLNFDYPVIHSIIEERRDLIKQTTDEVTAFIYDLAQETIKTAFPAIRDSDVIIPQLDLFKIWHFDNKARMTSLKKLEIAMNFPNVQDMPYKHYEEIKSVDQIKEILDYNINDVEATAVFYEKTIEKLNLRRGLMEKYGLKCMNYSDSKIGEQLMLKLYCKHTNSSEKIVRNLRTHRKNFKFAECIPDYVKFETPEFNGLLDYLKGINVSTLKESFKYSFEYGGFTFDLGTGGIHGCIKEGVYNATEDECITDADVSSLYPSLAVTLNLYPEHLGDSFASIYENGIVKPRLEAKKNGDKVMADGFKLSANSVYGKSNSEYSFLYDPLYTIKTTLSGQLVLCMLSEMLMTRVPNLKMLQINTDGLTVQMPVEHKRLYWEICKEWEAITRLGLEYVAYDKMIIRDVNNYIAVDKKGKVKYKGTFKPNSEMIKDGEYQKSFSQGIVAIAISDFFLKGIPVEETIKKHTNIYDFCKTFNASHGWICETVDYKNNGDEFNRQEEQKTNRYYISTDGKTFIKTKDEKKIEIESGKLVTLLNKYEEMDIRKRRIDYDYYINECYKIIHRIDGTTERIEHLAKLQREEAKRDKEREDYFAYCLNKVPTEKQFEKYGKEWLVEEYGKPPIIKPSRK